MVHHELVKVDILDVRGFAVLLRFDGGSPVASEDHRHLTKEVSLFEFLTVSIIGVEGLELVLGVELHCQDDVVSRHDEEDVVFLFIIVLKHHLILLLAVRENALVLRNDFLAWRVVRHDQLVDQREDDPLVLVSHVERRQVVEKWRVRVLFKQFLPLVVVLLNHEETQV